VCLFGQDGSTAKSLGVRVKTDKDTNVLERVLALGERTLGLAGASRLNDGLNFVRVDETGQVSVGQKRTGNLEALLDLRFGGGGTENAVKTLKGGLSPNDETANVTTGGELEEVEGGDGGELDTGDVAESTGDTFVLVVDDKRTTALTVATVAELTLTGTELLGHDNLLNINVGVDGLEESNGFLGLVHGLDLLGEDKGNFVDLFNLVTTGKDKGGNSRGSQSRGGSVTLLVDVGLDVPFAPDLGRVEHATTTAHVTESTLTGTVSTSTRDTRNTSNGTTGTP